MSKKKFKEDASQLPLTHFISQTRPDDITTDNTNPSALEKTADQPKQFDLLTPETAADKPKTVRQTRTDDVTTDNIDPPVPEKTVDQYTTNEKDIDSTKPTDKT